MRVLIVSQCFWPESFSINDIARSLVKKGLDVEVLTGKPNYPTGKIFDGYRAWGITQEEVNGAKVTRVPLIPRGKKSKLGLALNYLSFIASGLLFGPWLFRRYKPDVIFVYAPSPILQAIPALFLGWLKGCPVVLWVQDLWPESLSATGFIKNRVILWLVEQVVRFIYHHCELLLVPSQAFTGPVQALAGATPIQYFPNSVDASFALPATHATPKLPGLDADFSVMFAGNIGTAQAVETILDAAINLKDLLDIHFVVVGDGSRLAWMVEQVQKNDLQNLHLPGRLPIEEMPGLMQQASALLVTLADREIFAATVPNKIQAYMAAGRPIIACLPGEGARLVTQGGCGIAVPPEDGQALAEAVVHLYDMPDEIRATMGSKGRAYFFEHFDHDKLVDILVKYLQAASHKKDGT
ncbi:MAG: glycosyltransferase family 4 protein [Pseudomonadota bacterium]